MTTRKRTYMVVAVRLYEAEASEAERLTDVLQRAGSPKANRSLIVREALLRLEQDVAGKDDEGVLPISSSATRADAVPSTVPNLIPVPGHSAGIRGWQLRCTFESQQETKTQQKTRTNADRKNTAQPCCGELCSLRGNALQSEDWR
jgi:hypothetical protein